MFKKVSLVMKKLKAKYISPEGKDDQVVLEFMPAAIEILERPASPIGRTLGRIIILMIVVAFTWSCIGKLDVVSVAQGKIIPSGRVKVIQPLQKGVIKSVFVKEGELVEAGQSLVELDQSLTHADLNKLSHDLMFARLNLYRALSIRNKLKPNEVLLELKRLSEWFTTLPSEKRMYQNAWIDQNWLQFTTQLNGLEQKLKTQSAELEINHSDIERYEAVLPILTKRAESMKNLSTEKYVSNEQYLELEQQRIEYQQNMKMAQARNQMLISVLGETQLQIIEFKEEFLGNNLVEIEHFDREVANLE